MSELVDWLETRMEWARECQSDCDSQGLHYTGNLYAGHVAAYRNVINHIKERNE